MKLLIRPKEIPKMESIHLNFVPSLLLVDDDINVKSILNNYLSSNFKLAACSKWCGSN